MPEVTRLSWAGARLELDGLTLLVDPLFDAAPLERVGMGAPRSPLVAPAAEHGVAVDVVAPGARIE